MAQANGENGDGAPGFGQAPFDNEDDVMPDVAPQPHAVPEPETIYPELNAAPTGAMRGGSAHQRRPACG